MYSLCFPLGKWEIRAVSIGAINTFIVYNQFGEKQ